MPLQGKFGAQKGGIMYTRQELLEVLASVTGKDFDDVSIMYAILFSNADTVDIHLAHTALLEV